MNNALKLAQVGGDCVACGCCAAACPTAAVTIRRGVIAQIDPARCVGCGKCARVCPAAVITLVPREVTA